MFVEVSRGRLADKPLGDGVMLLLCGDEGYLVNELVHHMAQWPLQWQRCVLVVPECGGKQPDQGQSQHLIGHMFLIGWNN